MKLNTEQYYMISGHLHGGCWEYQCQETQASGVTTSHWTSAGWLKCPPLHMAQRTVSPDESLVWHHPLGFLQVLK